MRRSVIWSGLLHIIVLVLVVFGLPRLWDSADPVDAPTVVEVVKIDEKTTAKEQPKPKRAKPKTKEPKKVAAKKPPKARAKPSNIPEPPDINRKHALKAEKVPILPKPKNKVVKKEKKEKPEVKKPPRQIARVRPRRRPVRASREDFVRSLLKDVAPEERAEVVKKKVKKVEAPKPEPEKPVLTRAPLDVQATVSEIDVIRRQIEACWNIPAGARNAENLIVSIRVWVNPDGTVSDAKIIDSSRMNSDPFFRSAAESALRAVLNPRCSPLQIPPKKYDQFKELVLNFNPKEAAGS